MNCSRNASSRHKCRRIDSKWWSRRKCAHAPARVLKSQLSTGECWNPPKILPLSKEKVEATTKWSEECNHTKIKLCNSWVGDHKLEKNYNTEVSHSCQASESFIGFSDYGSNKGTRNPQESDFEGLWNLVAGIHKI